MSPFSKSWWILALRGAVSVLFGAIALTCSSIALGSLVFLFGVYAVFDGAACAAFGVASREEGATSFVAAGVVGIAAGLCMMVFPGLDSVSFYVLVGAWALLTGIAELLGASRLARLIPSLHGLVVGGALSIAFGALLIMVRSAQVRVLVMAIAVYAVLGGAAAIAAAMQIHRAPPVTVPV